MLNKAIVKLVLDWLWGKASELISMAVEYFKKKSAYKEIDKENKDQASKVTSASDEVKRLVEAGLPVPEELKEKMREESRRLVDGTFDPNRDK